MLSVYYGKRRIPKTHAARLHAVVAATTDYWVNDQHGDPLFVVTAKANMSTSKMLPALLAEVRKLIGDRRITVVFDRGGYSPKLFVKILDTGFDILTYRKGRWRKVARRHFQRQHAIIDGQRVDDVLADQEVRLLGGKLKLRQVTRLKGDHQTPVLTSRRDLSAVEVAYRMFERWRQENFFKYMREEFLLDALIDYDIEPDDPVREVPNPRWAEADRNLKLARARIVDLQRAHCTAKVIECAGAKSKLDRDTLVKTILAEVQRATTLQARRERIPRRVPVAETTDEEIIKLATQKKHLSNVIADATDNVAVTQVVFSQDGVSVGTVTVAPYALDLAVTAAINGRHRYTATVYDVLGNTAVSDAKRVLVAIDNKFFGTATTTAADYTNLLAHFNQVTPGNAGKWGSVEAVQGVWNWADLDTAYNFAKTNSLPFKLHTLLWGQQQPAWITSLSADQQLAAIDAWMAALATRYPNVDLIDVVNEPLHTQPSYIAALGGAGATGWDWVVKAFEMARAHFPNAELLLNEYFVLPRADFTANYVAVINVLKDRGLIDGIGEQGHFYERAPELPVLTANLATLAATGLPIYISELDINFADDARQAVRMSELFPIFWSNPSVLGITHWGYLPGTWQPNAYLIRSDGTLRPSLTWIECYRAGGTNCPVPVYVPTPRTGDVNGITVEAEDYDSAHDVLPAGTVVAYANDGSWLGFNQVVFNNNWDTLSVTYALGGSNTINLTVYLDSLATTSVATVALAPTGSWSTMKTVSIPWAPISVQKDVYFRFNGGGANLDKMQFGAPAGTGLNLLADSDFEQGTTASWSSWGTGTIANTTARAVSGTHSLAMTGRADNGPLAQ
jgi:GH35 family endo-1,4-beta-xylanase